MKQFLLATILALCTLSVLAQPRPIIVTTLTATLNDDNSVTLVAHLNNTGPTNVSTISSYFIFPAKAYLKISFSYTAPSHSSISSDIVSLIPRTFIPHQSFFL